MKMNRLHYEIEKNVELYDNICRIKAQVIEITSKSKACGITDHGLSHSERILEYLNELYVNCFACHYELLNDYEIFILLAAVYLHDIGYFLEDNENMKNFCSWNNVSFPFESKQDFYRKKHHLISAYWISENLKFNYLLPQVYFGENDLGYCIIKIVASHGINFWEHSQYHNEIEIKGYKIREKYLSFLLCMADAMDCDKRRIQNIGELSQYRIEDRIFVRRHNYVDRIVVQKNKINFYIHRPLIKLKYKNVFDEFYIKGTVKWINILLEKEKILFTEKNFSLGTNVNVQENNNVELPTDEEFDYIIKYCL